MKKLLSKAREYIPLFSLIVFAISFLSLILHIVIINSVKFADFFNYHLSSPTRMIMAWLTVGLPFSVAEIFIFMSPLVLAFAIFLAVKFAKRGKKASIRYLMVILAIACLIFVLFVWTYSSGFHTTPIEDKMNLDRQAIGKEELFLSSVIIVNRLNELANYIEYDEMGASVMPYSYGEMSSKINSAYKSFVNSYAIMHTYPSRIKPIILSEPMTYTHISGIYTFMSGEANVNVNYPDFIVAPTSAHEMAHQRGIAREDEANFVAFAVLLESDDPFLQYSAYLDIYGYVLNTLYDVDSDLYFYLVGNLDSRVLNDRRSYSKFFEKYADSVASDVADSVNNSYLQANGQEEGTKAYGMVTEIACAYLLKKQNNH